MSDTSLLHLLGVDDEDAEVQVTPLSAAPQLHGRSLARSQALQLLFQAEVTSRTVRELLSDNTYALSEGPLEEYAQQLALGADAKRDELDAALEKAAENWSLSRMSATDRNLLRLALYEIKYVDDVDPSVSINECVELAKTYSSSDKRIAVESGADAVATDDSARFVNGILGRIVRESE